MSKISELSLTKIVNGIKKKVFSSEEVTKSFIDNSKKSKKLNTYITECFDEALKFSKNFDKKKITRVCCQVFLLLLKICFVQKTLKPQLVVKYYIISFQHMNQQLLTIFGLKVLFY